MKQITNTPLSILDLVPYPQSKTIADALHASGDLARHAEKWGYNRYWIAEHHSIEGISSAATSVVIGYVAGQTSKIRVGSGGIMLPNHAPLVIAEQFGTLAALYPNRIDLGLGRAPGSDRLTMHALRRDITGQGTEFDDLIEELLFFFAPPEPGQRVKAIPGAGVELPIWILGSSLYSARLAAKLGRPYAFAGHFAPALMLRALELYRAEFQPSKHLDRPHVMIGVPVVAAETDERAEFLATTAYQGFLNLIRGKPSQALPPVSSMEGRWSPQEEEAVRSMLEVFVVGGPERARTQLQHLIDVTQADELIIASNFYDYADRVRSYEILAGVAQLTPR